MAHGLLPFVLEVTLCPEDLDRLKTGNTFDQFAYFWEANRDPSSILRRSGPWI